MRSLTPRAVLLRQQGWTQARIAQHFGVSRPAVCRYLKYRAAGKPTRKPRQLRPCTYCHSTLTPLKFCSPACYHASYKKAPYIQNRHGQRLGRKTVAYFLGPLPHRSVVHHEDRNTLNNAPQNLWLFRTHAEHQSYHRGGTGKPLWRGDELSAADLARYRAAVEAGTFT